MLVTPHSTVSQALPPVTPSWPLILHAVPSPLSCHPTPHAVPDPPFRTFAFPVGMSSKAYVASILAVELRHEGLVGVADEQNGGVEGLDLLLPTLMGLDADGPPTSPVVPLTFEPCAQRESRS